MLIIIDTNNNKIDGNNYFHNCDKMNANKMTRSNPKCCAVFLVDMWGYVVLDISIHNISSSSSIFIPE